MAVTFNPFTGTFDFTGSTGGGGGSISGTIAATQVAFGTGVDTIGGSANLVWDGSALKINTSAAATAANNLSFFAATTSAQLAGVISDETGTGVLVFGTSPTIVTPTIASFANATHTHLNAAGGGTLTAAAVTDLNSATITFTNKSGNISQWTNDSGYLISVTAHNVLSATHGDTLTASVVRGDVIIGNSTPKWSRLAIGSSGKVLTSDGTDVSWQTPAGGGITIGTTAITSGSTTRILYDNAGVVGEYTLTGTGTVVVMATAPTVTGPMTLTEVAGSSALTLTGATQTTSFPVISATQTWNASGTAFVGALLNITNTASNANSASLVIQTGGSNRFYVKPNGNVWWLGSVEAEVHSTANLKADTFVVVGNVTTTSPLYFGSGTDTQMFRTGAAAWQFGPDVNGAGTNQSFAAANGITGTDKTGGNFTLASGKGTGAGAVSSLIFQTPTVLSTGTTAQSLATRLTITSGSITIADATDLVLNATTGTKFGTATGQKQAWWGATPVVQQLLATGASHTVDDVITLLQTLGLCKQS